MHDLLDALLAPSLALLLLLVARRWPVAGLPGWSALACLLPFALACLLAFPSLDDWSYGASGRHGWWAAQHDWYVGWSGRISTTAVITGWGSIGSPWFAAVIGYRAVIILLFAGMCWALLDLMAAVLPQLDRPRRWTLAATAAAGWISLLKDPAEGLYWLPGVSSYGIGSLLALVVCSTLLRGADCPRWRWRLALPALAIACLSGEVVAALALTAVAGLIAVRLRGFDRWRGLAILAGGLLATAILVMAPGNLVRALNALGEGQPPVDHGPLALIGSTGALAWRFIGDAPWAPLAALGAWIAWQSPARSPLTGAKILLLAPVFILAAAVPMAWAGMSPGRAWNPVALTSSVAVVIGAWYGGPRLAVPLLLAGGAALINSLAPGLDTALVALGGWGAVLCASWLLRSRLDRGALISCLAVAMLLGAERFASAPIQLAAGPGYAVEQQQRLAILAGAPPGSALVVPRLSGSVRCFYHTSDLGFSTHAWQNQGCAAFFGLQSVRTR